MRGDVGKRGVRRVSLIEVRSDLSGGISRAVFMNVVIKPQILARVTRKKKGGGGLLLCSCGFTPLKIRFKIHISFRKSNM